MFDFLKRKSSKDRLQKLAVELQKGHHYVIIVPADVNPDELLETGFFDDFNVFLIQANRVTIMEIE